MFEGDQGVIPVANQGRFRGRQSINLEFFLGF
jgi:hypothetical protein